MEKGHFLCFDSEPMPVLVIAVMLLEQQSCKGRFKVLQSGMCLGDIYAVTTNGGNYSVKPSPVTLQAVTHGIVRRIPRVKFNVRFGEHAIAWLVNQYSIFS